MRRVFLDAKYTSKSTELVLGVNYVKNKWEFNLLSILISCVMCPSKQDKGPPWAKPITLWSISLGKALQEWVQSEEQWIVKEEMANSIEEEVSEMALKGN